MAIFWFLVVLSLSLICLDQLISTVLSFCTWKVLLEDFLEILFVLGKILFCFGFRHRLDKSHKTSNYFVPASLLFFLFLFFFFKVDLRDSFWGAIMNCIMSHMVYSLLNTTNSKSLILITFTIFLRAFFIDLGSGNISAWASTDWRKTKWKQEQFQTPFCWTSTKVS